MKLFEESILNSSIKAKGQRINVSISATSLTRLIENGSLSINDVYPTDRCSKQTMHQAFLSGLSYAIAP